MSPPFLLRLSRQLDARFDLARDLGVSGPEVETILVDPLLSTDEDRMFKVRAESRRSSFTLSLLQTKQVISLLDD
jgi:hypothetical protein